MIILNTQYKIHVKINKNITHQKQQPNTKQTNKTPKNPHLNYNITTHNSLNQKNKNKKAIPGNLTGTRRFHKKTGTYMIPQAYKTHRNQDTCLCSGVDVTKY